VTVRGVVTEVVLVFAPASVVLTVLVDDAAGHEAKCEQGHQPGEAGGDVRHGVAPNEAVRPTSLGLVAWSPELPKVIKNYF
jgi:hypothetical protein